MLVHYTFKQKELKHQTPIHIQTRYSGPPGHGGDRVPVSVLVLAFLVAAVMASGRRRGGFLGFQVLQGSVRFLRVFLAGFVLLVLEVGGRVALRSAARLPCKSEETRSTSKILRPGIVKVIGTHASRSCDRGFLREHKRPVGRDAEAVSFIT